MSWMVNWLAIFSSTAIPLSYPLTATDIKNKKTKKKTHTKGWWGTLSFGKSCFFKILLRKSHTLWNEIFHLLLSTVFESIGFSLCSLSVACVVSAWHFLLLMVGGTTAVMKAGAISKMDKIGPVCQSWSKERVQIWLAIVLVTLAPWLQTYV